MQDSNGPCLGGLRAPQTRMLITRCADLFGAREEGNSRLVFAPLAMTTVRASGSEPTPPPIHDVQGRDVPFIVFSGFSMGTADVVPGVSGGTMAIALGIYHHLLSAIASINARAISALLKLQFREVLAQVHYRFLLALIAGLGLGVAVMVKVVRLPELILSQPKPVYAVFFGLVLASALLLARTIPRWNLGRVLSLLLGCVFGFAVVNLVPVQTPNASWFLFLCGFIAICAMVLPGISGSFVLLILGKYSYVLGALGDLNLWVIAPFACGALIGITTFSRVVAWALTRFHDPVLAGLVGLLLGSLWRIWPYQHVTTVIVRDKPRVIGAQPYWPETFEPTVLALLAAGIALVFALEFVAGLRRRSAAMAVPHSG